MNLFEAVKEAVPARTAAEHYGIKVRRNGMACCPFHSDRTPSMKLDRRFHCFGCQADGDVIDFTVKLFGLNPKEAAEKLAQDFGIFYDDRHYCGRSNTRASPLLPQLSAVQEYQQAERRVYRAYCDYFHLLRKWKEDYAPQSPDEKWDERFVEACQKLSYVEYLLDTLLTGSIDERAAIVKEHGKDVIQLEKRISELTAGGTGGRSPCRPGNEPAGYYQAKSARSFNDCAL